MQLKLPVRRYLQTTGKVAAPALRFGRLQWVLSRALYRFQTFELTQVPAKNRNQALQLELTQWSPFAQSGYFVGWLGTRAWVWAWDADKVKTAMAAQGLTPRRTTTLPESLLHAPLPKDGLCLTHCSEGLEGQLWRARHLERSRWWAQTPTPDEWLSFQRDASISPAEQKTTVPAPRHDPWAMQPWLRRSEPSAGLGNVIERPLMGLGSLCLLTPALWLGLNYYQVAQNTALLQAQQAQLQIQVAPIMQARGQALDHLARISALQAIARSPSQLALMNSLTQALPNNGPTLKDWDFSGNQLKITLTAPTDLAATPIIAALQQAGPFGNVTALPGRDPKSVMFKMDLPAQ